MTVLIDPPAWPAHGRLWSHLVSDTSFEELHAFAARHGVPRRGFERDHYDVPADSYERLVAAGAQPVDARQLVRSLESAGLRRRKAAALARRRPGRELLRPPRLAAGDLVAVVAPAGVVPREQLYEGVARLESWGLRVRIGAHVLDQHPSLGHLAGDDADRAGDFVEAWMDPEVAAVMLARGGYGTQRILDAIDWKRLAEARPKVVIGFSDVTALHEAVASRLGVVSVHGHVVTSLAAAEPGSLESLRRLLLEPEATAELLEGQPVRTWAGGRADGVLLGGNLMLLASGVGTAFSRRAAGGIVLLEDVSESPYRLDRELTQLTRSGWFDDVRGIVLGAFTDCGEAAEVEGVLAERLLPLGVPMVGGVDVGHTSTTLSIPLGVAATLDADAGRLTLRHPALV